MSAATKCRFKPLRLNRHSLAFHAEGQVTLEFTFCIIIVLLLVYGCIMAFRWAGLSLADRRIQHEETLFNGISESWVGYNQGPAKQIDPDFSEPLPMNMVFNGW